MIERGEEEEEGEGRGERGEGRGEGDGCDEIMSSDVGLEDYRCMVLDD